MRMEHYLDKRELDWLMRWVKGEPEFGPEFGRKGDIARFFEWRRSNVLRA